MIGHREEIALKLAVYSAAWAAAFCAVPTHGAIRWALIALSVSIGSSLLVLGDVIRKAREADRGSRKPMREAHHNALWSRLRRRWASKHRPNG